MTKNIGTLMYIAPEQMTLSYYDSRVDIYSLGLILFELCHHMKTGHERNKTMNSLRLQIYPKELDECPNEKELIRMMTQLNPSLRPSVEDIFLSEAYLNWKNQHCQQILRDITSQLEKEQAE